MKAMLEHLRNRFRSGPGRSPLVGAMILTAGLGLGAVSVQSSDEGKAQSTPASQDSKKPMESGELKTVEGTAVRIFVTGDVDIHRPEGDPDINGFGTFTIEYQLDGSDITVKMGEDDATTVTVNGEVVPPERVRREKGKLLILDADGNVTQTLGLFPGWHREFFRRGPREREGRYMELSVIGKGDNEELGWVEKVPSYGFRFEPPPVMLGVFMRETPEPLVKHLRLTEDATVMITGLHEGLPAQRAGLQQYDIILRVDGQSPVSRRMIFDTLKTKQPGDDLAMDVIQCGEEKSFTVELEAFDAERMANATLIGEPPYARGDWAGRHDGPRGQWHGLDRIIVAPGRDDFFKLPEGGSPVGGDEIRAILGKVSEGADGAASPKKVDDLDRKAEPPKKPDKQ